MRSQTSNHTIAHDYHYRTTEPRRVKSASSGLSRNQSPSKQKLGHNNTKSKALTIELTLSGEPTLRNQQRSRLMSHSPLSWDQNYHENLMRSQVASKQKSVLKPKRSLTQNQHGTTNSLLNAPLLSSRSEMSQLETKFKQLATLLKLPKIDQHYYLRIFAYSEEPKPEYLAVIIDMLMLHKSRTIEVLRSIDMRERIWDLLLDQMNAYSLIVDSEEMKTIQKSTTKLLSQLQVASLEVVENIMRWRQNLTRPFAFSCYSHGNYIVKMRRDCEYFDRSTLSNSLFTSFERSGYLFSRFAVLDIRDDSPFDQIERRFSPLIDILAPKSPSRMNDPTINRKIFKRLQKAETIIRNEEDIQMVLHMDCQQKKRKHLFVPVLDTRNILPDCKNGIPIEICSKTSADTDEFRNQSSACGTDSRMKETELCPMNAVQGNETIDIHVVGQQSKAKEEGKTPGVSNTDPGEETLLPSKVADLYSHMPSSPVHRLSHSNDDKNYPELKATGVEKAQQPTVSLQEKSQKEGAIELSSIVAKPHEVQTNKETTEEKDHTFEDLDINEEFEDFDDNFEVYD